jgi:hypothetical protein
VFNHYQRFLKFVKYKGKPIEPSQLLICLFIVYLFKLELTYGTVRSYLFSFASELKIRGGRDILVPFDSWFIRSTLRHYRMKLGNKAIHYRRPLTIDILCKLIRHLDLFDFDTRVYATMAVVGVYGLLRIGELCFTRIGDKNKFIKNKDVSCIGGTAIIKLFGTKTDFDKKGIVKYFCNIKGAYPNPYSLIFILKSMKNADVKGDDAFFTLSNGRPVTRPMFVGFLQKRLSFLYPNIDKKEWNGVSLRKGGATSAMRAGVHSEIIQQLGGWSTDIYKTYLDHSLTDVTNAQTQIAKTTTML